MILKQNKEIENNKWVKLIKNSTYSSPFQTAENYKFFNSIENFSAHVFAVEVGNEYKALALVTIQKEKGLKSYFSRRGIIYGGPLVLDNNKQHLDFLLKEIVKFFRGKLIYLETRNFFSYSEYKYQFKNSGFDYVPWLNFQLDTISETLVKKNMSSSRWRQIKKAIKNGASWAEANSIKDVEDFYEILFNLYNEKIRKPLLPKSFFIDFFKKEMGKYLLIYFENKVIGGIMCPILPGKTIYEFYIAGLDLEYKDQYPSVMATWAAIEYALQNKIPLFDFMGAGSPDEDYGVRDFKARFGGELVEHGRFIYILNPSLYKLGKIGLKLLSKMK